MRGIYGLMIFLLTSAVAVGNPCSIRQAELPLCEGPGRMVPKHQPAAVSFPPSQLSTQSLGNLIVSLNRDSSPTKIGLTESQLKSLRALDPRSLGVTSAQFQDMLQKQTATFDSDQGHPTSEADTQYMRDATIYGVDPSTGNLRISRSGFPNKYTPYKTGGTFCGLPVTFEQRPAGSQSNRGGNVIALPGGACLSAEGASKEFLDMVCGPDQKRITVGRRGTNLGHVDEIINVVPLPGKEPPCNFAVVMASHRKFNEVLGKNPDKPFFGEEGLKKVRGAELSNSCQSGQCMKMPSTLCKALDKMSWLLRVENELAKSRANQPGIPGQKSKTQSQNGLSSEAQVRMPAAAMAIGDAEKAAKNSKRLAALEQENFPSLYAADRDFSAPDCSRYRNQDVLKLYENKALFQRLRSWLDEEGKPFLEKNAKEDHFLLKSKTREVKEGLDLMDGFQKMAEKFDVQQDESWKKIKEALPAQCRNDAQRVELPMGLHQGGLNPNPTNLQVIGSNALYPEQFNSELDREMKTRLKALGLNPVPVNTLMRHTGGGNVHCLSNEIRTCRPR